MASRQPVLFGAVKHGPQVRSETREFRHDRLEKICWIPGNVSAIRVELGDYFRPPIQRIHLSPVSGLMIFAWPPVYLSSQESKEVEAS
jgi:hypothetical protein